MRWTLYQYRRPFKKRLREGFLLRLKTTAQEGWGEIAPLPGFSNETLEEARKDLLSKKLSLPCAQFGYHTALLDLQSPIQVSSIPIKHKTKAGHLSLEEALKTVTPEPKMRIDFNRKWKLDEALTFAKKFPNVEYFEEPLIPGENRKDFPYPVALDESLREEDHPPYPQIVAHVIKPTLHGFPLPKPQKGIHFILSSSYESELGLHQIAKLAYRLKLPLIPMGLATSNLFEAPLFEEELTIKNDHLHFPKKWTLIPEKVETVFDEHI